MNKNETTLPVQGNALARVQTWLSQESEFFTALLEHPVTNEQALRKKSAASLGRFAENRHLCSVQHLRDRRNRSAKSSLRTFFMPKADHIGSVPCGLVNAPAACLKVLNDGERNLFYSPMSTLNAFNIMRQNSTTLPVQGNALARVQTWLSLESEFFTELLEQPVTNGQALRLSHATVAGFAVPLAAAVSPMTAALTLAWWVCTLLLCRKGGAR